MKCKVKARRVSHRPRGHQRSHPRHQVTLVSSGHTKVIRCHTKVIIYHTQGIRSYTLTFESSNKLSWQLMWSIFFILVWSKTFSLKIYTSAREVYFSVYTHSQYIQFAQGTPKARISVRELICQRTDWHAGLRIRARHLTVI